ncbi:MAG: adenosylcobinamide-GDP ribazoletransferase [Bacteroidaceae bacterium]|nr:adenosylcobinamide-GDP ribazoletransferase [Bacteroidaceae bacterium]
MRLLASLIFFTRLPWWRLKSVPQEAFAHVVDYWPFVGWLTGGCMALVFWGASVAGWTTSVAALLAIVARVLLTGALHEDGLADFCDGFGGGTSRARTLSIMKDSHIGTYGVLGLIFYFGLLWTCFESLSLFYLPDYSIVYQLRGGSGAPASDVLAGLDSPFTLEVKWVAVILLFDVLAKVAASLITGQLPYARTAEEAKNQVVYVGRTWQSWLWHALRCLLALSLPVGLCLWTGLSRVLLLLPVPFLVEWLLMRWMRRRLGGYTGDCCGALFLLCELSLYLVFPLLF